MRPIGEVGAFRIISVEDLIADRMGQFASGSAPEMRGQAQALLRLYPDMDSEYLERRIREETAGDHGIEESKAEREATIDMAAFGRELRQRRAAAGPLDVPRNSGKRRTASKRALLKAIEQAGGKW